MKTGMVRKRTVFAVVFSVCAFDGCMGTTTGNPPEGSSGSSDSANVAISSDAYSTAAYLAPPALRDLDLGRALDPGALTSVSEFKFCVKRVKLEGEDGTPKKKTGELGDNGEADPEDIRFAPGLVDVGAGSERNWGTANIPVGFKLRKIKIKVKKDKTLCGVDYSISFNGHTTTEDVEFKWKFEPPIDLDKNTGAIAVSLSAVSSALRIAADAGKLDKVKDAIEAIEDSAKKK